MPLAHTPALSLVNERRTPAVGYRLPRGGWGNSLAAAGQEGFVNPGPSRALSTRDPPSLQPPAACRERDLIAAPEPLSPQPQPRRVWPVASRCSLCPPPAPAGTGSAPPAHHRLPTLKCCGRPPSVVLVPIRFVLMHSCLKNPILRGRQRSMSVWSAMGPQKSPSLKYP